MIDTRDLIAEHLALMAGKPGDIIITSGRPLRRGEVYCDGRELDRVTYARAFAAIGVSWGAGNGTTTFNIPDLRGCVLAASDDQGIRGNARRLNNTGAGAAGINATTVGSRGGTDRKSAVVGNLPAGVLSRTSGFGTAVSGKTTGTGGDQLYETTATVAPLSIVQPTAICNFVFLLGRDEVIVAPVPEPGTGTSDLEFNGPFPDWLDVVNDFDAVGDGVTDDSDAIENLIHSLIQQDLIGSADDMDTFYGAACGYLPGGTVESPKVYRITRTIRLPNKDAPYSDTAGAFATRLCGADPRTTIIKWDGEPGGTMFWACGWHSGCLSRVTLDGSGTAQTGIRIEHDPDISLNQSFNRIADVFFKDMARGIENTNLIAGTGTDSEIDIMRCRFYRCTEFGIFVIAPEAYDYWVRSCYFEGCGVGVGRLIDPQYADFTDTSAFDPDISGQFSVWDSVFNGSLLYDIDALAGQNIEIRGCASFNSRRFIRMVFANATVADNRIVNPVLTDCFQIITQYGALPNAMIARNQFKLRAGASGAVISHIYNAALDLFRLTGEAANNDPRYMNFQTYYFANKFSMSYSEVIALDPYFTERFADSQRVWGTLVGQTISDAAELICPVPPQISRQTFVMTNPPINGQTTIDAAAAYEVAHPGSRPVIYYPFFADIGRRVTGETTFEFPANVRMSMQGGHERSRLDWGVAFDTSAPDTPLLVIRGPSLMSFEQFTIASRNEGNKAGAHVVVDNCNQAGARLYSEGCDLWYKFQRTHNLSAYIVNATIAPREDPDNDEAFEVIGDTSEPATGGVLIEGATGSIATPDPGTKPMFDVADGGRLWLRGHWHETTQAGQIQFKLSGADQPGWLSVESSRFRPGDSQFPPGVGTVHWRDVRQMLVDGWSGDMVLSCLDMIGRPLLQGDLGGMRWLNYSSWLYAFDDGGHFRTYDGTAITIKGVVVDTPDPLPFNNLPAEGNTDGDGWHDLNNGHLWVWKDDTWNDIGGIVVHYQAEADLPADYAGAALDCAIVSDTSEVWQWSGSAWTNLADGSAPLPATYWHSEGASTGIANQSQNWGLHKWYDSPPVGIGGALPGDYLTVLATMLDRRPPKFLQPLGAGITDIRFSRFQASVWFVPGTFTMPT